MASLVQAVRFMDLASQLNDVEFGTFIIDFIKKRGRSCLLSMIFNHLSDSNNDDDGVLKEFISIINGVIRKREDDVQTICTSTMASLSAPLIGKIGTFLNQEDHIHFGLVSRSVFIGCNTPNTLRHLNLIGIQDYSKIDICRYTQLRILKFNLSAFRSFNFQSIGYVFRYLHKIEIDNTGNHVIQCFDALSRCPSINFPSITHLCLSNFSTITRSRYNKRLSAADFIKLLSMFPCLEYLYLCGVFIQQLEIEEISQFIDFSPRLGVFISLGSRAVTSRQMMSALAPKLKGLRFNFSPGSGNPLFPVLEELRVTAPGMALLQNYKALKRVCLNLIDGIDTNEVSEAVPMITDLIMKATKMETLVIKAKMNLLESVCTAIDRGIFGVAKKRDRSEIKLWISCEQSSPRKLKATDITHHLSEVIDRLQSISQKTQIAHFVLMWRFRSRPLVSGWDRAMKKLRKQHRETLNITSNKRNIMVTSKGCSISPGIQNYMTVFTHDFLTSQI